MEEERWRVLEKGLTKAVLILDGCKVKEVFTSEDYIQYYDCVYHIAQRYSHHQALVDRFKKALEHGIVSKVLPSVIDKDGVHLLTEFLQLWSNYKTMAKCVRGFFQYLDCQIADLDNGTPRLVDISFCIFHELVCKVLHQRLNNAAVFLINQHRDSVQIHEHLLSGMFLLYVEFGEHGYKSYYDMFEEAILKDAASYYSRVSSELYPGYSGIDYVLKVEQCLIEEYRRARKFLQKSSAIKLLKVMYKKMF